jgi:hypothetical protein
MDQLTHQEGDRHAGHKMAEAQASHDRHAGRSVAMFRDKFGLFLAGNHPKARPFDRMRHFELSRHSKPAGGSANRSSSIFRDFQR